MAAITEKELRKFFAEIQRQARQGKPTAELITRFDALAFARYDTRAFDVFLEAQSLQEIFTYLSNNPEGQAAKILTRNAEERARAQRGARPMWDLAFTNTTLELVSTTKVTASQTAIGLGRNFIEALLATDIDSTATEGLHSPFPGPFIVRFPRGFYLKHQWQFEQKLLPLEIAALAPIDMRGLSIPSDIPVEQQIQETKRILNMAAEGRFDEDAQTAIAFVTTFRSGVDPRSDFNDPGFIQSNAVFGSVLPLTTGHSGPTTVGDIRGTGWFPYSQSEYIQLDEDGEEIRRGSVEDLQKIIYGLLLYLNTHNPSLLRVSNRKTVKLSQLVQAPERARKIRATMSKPRTAQTVIVSEEVEELPREAYKTLVRGHFRNQPYGPRRSLRRIQWIKPFIRHKDAPGDPRADYDLDGVLEEGLPGERSCDEMYRELWRIQKDIKHVQAGIETHMFSDPEYTIELQMRLEELESEYADLYVRYQESCARR
jgi:hypothetical protein